MKLTGVLSVFVIDNSRLCGFRGHAGHHSDLIPAGVPINFRPPVKG